MNRSEAGPSKAKKITFSIVVNTCDRAEHLRALLYALNRQSYPHFEVIVVVGPTTDHSIEVVEEFGGQAILARCPEFNLSMSRNIGIAAATGDIVAFIDDDAIPSFTWLEQLAAIFANPDVAGAGGKVPLIHPGHGYLQFRYGLFSLLGEDMDVRSSPDEEIVSDTPAQYWYPRLMGTNMAYRRQALIDVGGFDERFAFLLEEPDLAVRLGLKGYQVQPSAEAVVYHAPASSRNREVFTWNLNWYAWMRGIIYFTLKNAGPVVGLRPALFRSIQHCLIFFYNVRYGRKYDSLSADLYPHVIRQLIKGIAWGFWFGLFMPRKIPKAFQTPDRRFRPFLIETSSLYPNVRPLSPAGKGPIKPMEKEPLRICLLSSEYPPHDTEGVARLTHLMAQGLSALGHEVHVIKEGKVDHTTFYDGAYVHEVHPVQFRYLNYRNNGYFNLAWCLNYSHAVYERVRSLVINHQIQIVDSPLWRFEGLVTAVAEEVPVVVRLVTSMKQLATMDGYADLETQLFGDLEARFLELSRGLIPISRAIQQTCAQVYGINFSNRPHRVIHAGLKPLPEVEILPFNGQHKAEPIILFVGRLEKRKGILSLFQAIPQVLQSFPKAQFWLVGKDNSENDGFAAAHQLTYPQYFQKKYRAYTDRVRFLGYADDSKLGSLYQICDLFVAPSLYESFGLIFLEAMNHARPVIGCNVGGPTEIVENGQTGVLVPPESPSALAEAIIRLLDDPKARREMGLAGRQRLLDHFTYTKMAEGYVDFYRELLK